MRFLNKYGFSLAAAAATATLGKFQWEDVVEELDKQERVSKAVQRFLVTEGVPGASVGVSINGRTVLASGYGFADVENERPCTKDTLMRIASISKSITASIAAKLVESGKLELDKSIYDYVTDFPRKKFDNTEVDITIRQLLSHRSGIRHYKKIFEDKDLEKWDKLFVEYGQGVKDAEVLYRNVYKNTAEAVELFKNDDLLSKPGTKYSYTTNGFTLLALCLEKAANESFGQLAKKVFNELKMTNTHLDKNEPLIKGRAKFYRRNMKHVLVNVPEVDCSYKYASGGILSNVEDLLKFGNAMLQSYQTNSPSNFLKSSTVHEFWDKSEKDADGYALGWIQWPTKCVDKDQTNRIWYHTGAAIGASSILLMKSDLEPCKDATHPQGICVAILVNLQGVDPRKLALEIVDIYTNGK